MDAIKFIIAEHKKIKKSLIAIGKKSVKFPTKVKKFADLTKYLVMHETMEEKKWYPHFQNNVKVKRIVQTVIAEEKAAGKALKVFKKIKQEAVWNEGFLLLKNAILQHAKAEELKLFPKVKLILDKEDLLEIGKTLQKFKAAKLKKK